MVLAVKKGSRRRTLLVIAFVVLLVPFGWAVFEVLTSGRFRVDDFVEYWAAGRLNMTDGNPYLPGDLLPLQRAAGLEGDEPVMMWNPPWSLALVMPFALWTYGVDRLLWLLLNLALLLGAVTYIWWYYGGPPRRRWVAPLVLVTYMPALLALLMGQISALLLVGILGFLHFESRRRWVVAGAFAALVAIKPQLIYLFWIALLLWVIDRRAWKVAWGTLGALGIGTAVTWLVNHDVIGQYITAATSYPPRDWATPTIGAGFRMVFGFEHFWLQLLPALGGALWFFWHWRRERQSWCWAEQMPLLLVIALATTPYGWAYDQVVLLLPILQVAVWTTILPWGRTSTLLLIGYLLLDGLALRQGFTYTNAFWLLWLAPAFLLWYLLARRSLGRRLADPNRAIEVLQPADPMAQRMGQ